LNVSSNLAKVAASGTVATRGVSKAVPSGKCVHPASVSQDDALLGLLEGGVHVP